MLIEDRFFDQGWVQELPNEDFRMLLYLMHFATKKCGIVELNMRMLNFAANTGKTFTAEEVLERFGGMLKLIPGKKSTAIFPDWVSTNWAKGGKSIDTTRNPLFKSIVQELASFGMTLDDLNALAKTKVVVKDSTSDEVAKPTEHDVEHTAQTAKPAKEQDVGSPEDMFEEFWKAYPGPRKVDKRKCLGKFLTALSRGATFDDIMRGLSAWKKCSTWNKDGGEFIRAPLVWLNNENWKEPPDDSCGGAVVTEEARREAVNRKIQDAIMSLTAEDWCLCREAGCSNFNGVKCARFKLPCGHTLQPRPRPPSECPGFIETKKEEWK